MTEDNNNHVIPEQWKAWQEAGLSNAEQQLLAFFANPKFTEAWFQLPTVVRAMNTMRQSPPEHHGGHGSYGHGRTHQHQSWNR